MGVWKSKHDWGPRHDEFRESKHMSRVSDVETGYRSDRGRRGYKTLVFSGWKEHWIKGNGSIVVLEKGDVECDCDGMVAKALRQQK